MKPLVLTSFLIPEFIKSGLADLAVHFFYRFIWGPLASADELKAYLSPRAPDQHSGTHWSAFTYDWEESKQEEQDLGLAEFCQQYETVELWFDTRPYAQLQLAWLLDHFSSYPETVAASCIICADTPRSPHGADGRFCSPQPDPAVVGWNEIDQQESMAVGLGQ